MGMPILGMRLMRIVCRFDSTRARQSRFFRLRYFEINAGGWKERIYHQLTGNQAVNKYLDDIRRTLLAWYRIGREPVFHACYAIRLELPEKLLI